MDARLQEARSLLDELRLATMWRLFAISAGVVWLWMMFALFGRPQIADKVLAILIALVISAFFTYLLSQHKVGLAMPCFVVSLILTLTVALVLLRNADLIYLYSVPVLFAGVLIRPYWGFIAAGLVGVTALLLTSAQSDFATHISVPVVLIVTGAAALLAWTFARKLYLVVDWMYQSYLLAEQRTNEARLHRSRLHSALKDLDLAYYRLTRANEALAWARREAEEARQAKARFAANVSHELRTPLNLIIGFSEMMATAPESYGQPLPSAYRGDLTAIYRNARHLSDLIDDVLDLSQIEADCMPLTRETSDLVQLVEQAVHMVQRVVEAKGLQLIVELPSRPVMSSLDVTRIRQVILNLLGNAVRFTRTGKITVRLTAVGSEATVSVEDTGPGIAKEMLPRLFEEFYQVDDSIRREYGGTGLGLAISKRFVELHGGRIWAESKPGEGSTFHFTLPTSAILPAEQRPMGKSHKQVISKESQRILVVWHRDTSTAAILQRHFETYRIHPVESAADMYEAINRFHPTAVIVDTKHQAAAKAMIQEASCAEIPLISCPLPTRPKMAVGLQSTDYLLKPVTRDALGRALAKAPQNIAKALIVDDDPAMVRLLTRMLYAERPQVQALQAYNGVYALDIARAEHPDLILLDLLLPGLSGIDVLEQIRSDPELRDIGVIVITATELGEQVAQYSGELKLQLLQPVFTGEWLKLLRAITDALRPAPDLDETTARVPAPALPG